VTVVLADPDGSYVAAWTSQGPAVGQEPSAASARSASSA